jgi:hypothetical protein
MMSRLGLVLLAASAFTTTIANLVLRAGPGRAGEEISTRKIIGLLVILTGIAIASARGSEQVL